MLEEEPKSFSDQFENVAQKGVRNIARTASNLGTRAVGLPGDIFSLINEYIARPTQKAFGGGEGVPYEETLLGKALPTTEAHRKGIERVSGEYLKPKNESEKFIDDVIEDTALLFSPGGMLTKTGKTVKGAQQLYRNLGKAVTANIAAEGVKGFAQDERAGDYAKIGSLVILSLLDKPSAAKQIGNLYKNAENALPPNASQSASKLSSDMNKLIHRITKGRPTSVLSKEEKFVTDQAENVLSLVQNGRIGIDQAWAQLRTVNKHLDDILPELPWKARKGVKSNITSINQSINDTLKDYGKSNPNFAKNFHPAQKAIETMHRSNAISNWVSNNVRIPLMNEFILHMFGGVPGEVTSTAFVPYKAGQVAYRIARSPALRQIYGDALMAASKENVGSFNKFLNKLDKEFSKESSREKWVLED